MAPAPIPRNDAARRGAPNRALIALAIAALLLFALLGLLGLKLSSRLGAIESRLAELGDDAAATAQRADVAQQRAEEAAKAARAAAEGRRLAEAGAARAEEDAQLALEDAATSRVEAEEARAEAERVRQLAEAELNRLEEALGKIATTRRTALGLVMNLGEDSIKFDFDKAALKPENKELLSRIAGILLTSTDYTVEVNGHTDDVGNAAYNQKLSERRAQSVRDYLVEAGIDARILTVQGFGKTEPLVAGTDEAARAKNRRVELGIVNTQIRYPHARR